MSLPTIRALLARELRALRREVEAYPDDASVWAVPAGIGNSAGTLVLHLAGNLQHFVGAVLGDSGYVRQRDQEFTREGLPRSELVEQIEATARAVDTTLAALPSDRLEEPFPALISGRRLPTGDVLMHLCSHLAYHLGQVDYHRRITTGDGGTVNTVSVEELAEPNP